VGPSVSCSNSYLLGALVLGYVKGAITDAVRRHFIPNDVRRHRLISVNCISLLPYHRQPSTELIEHVFL
jgi:hypothetical protein